MNMTVMPQSKLNSVQALRGLAALFVLIYHISQQQLYAIGAIGASARTPTVDLWLLSGPWNQGYAGVDLFFVISGFIMVYVTQKFAKNAGQKAADVAAFLYKRIVRIYPLWWVFASVMGGYYFLSKGIWASPHFGFSAPESFIYFFKSLALIPQGHLPVLGVGWTLIHEMQFYLIFALLLLAPRRYLPVLLGGWAGLNIAGYYMGLAKLSAIASVLFSPFSLQFIIGAAVALLIVKRIYVAPKICLALGVVAICVAILVNMDSISVLKPSSRLFFYGLPFAVIIYGLCVLEQQGRLNIPRGLVHLGDWSYSLYLSHYIVLIIIGRLGRELMPYLPESIVSNFSIGTAGLIDNIAYSIAALILAIIAAGISFYIIERPLLRLARRGK